MLSIIVPTYREAENIQPLVQRIRAVLDSKLDYEVIFVDDNSNDGIVQRIEELQRQGAPVRLIVRTKERGLSNAIYHGFRQARGELLLSIDADLSHPPEVIPQMLEALDKTGADMVIGSRYVKGGSTDPNWGWYRLFNSHLGRWVAMPLNGVRDSGSGFYLLPGKIFARAADLNPIGYKSGLEISVKARCKKIIEIPIHFADRQHGESKMNFAIQWAYLVHLKRLYVYRFFSNRSGK